MVSISGSKKLKRQMAPLFWGIPRKSGRFVVTVRPGPHPRDRAVPTAVLLRDMLGVVSTLREAKAAIYSGKVRVDGVVRRSLHHAIGLMDVVELEGVSDIYRMAPSGDRLLAPLRIDASEKGKKLVRVGSKTSLRGGRTQVGFHDGRTAVTDKDVRVGDTCLIGIPGQEILDVVRLEPGCTCLVTRGVNAGQTGRIESLEKGTFILPRRAVLALEGRKIEIPTDIVMAIGREGPLLRLS